MELTWNLGVKEGERYLLKGGILVRPDQFNFLLLGSLQLKNGANDRKKKKKKGDPDWPDKIFNMKNNLKIQDKTPNLKKHAHLHERLTNP